MSSIPPDDDEVLSLDSHVKRRPAAAAEEESEVESEDWDSHSPAPALKVGLEGV
jgi:hypothetical protein